MQDDNQHSDQVPIYNLKVVVQETGLKPDTLRVWERRYGLPQPHRTPGGHRLYSQQDIDTLKWLVARQKEGMSISKAVQLWLNLEAEGKNPLLDLSASPSKPETGFLLTVSGEALNTLKEAWLEACLAFDRSRCDQVLDQAFAIYPVETVCLEIVRASLVAVGQGWYEGRISVQQEHFASAMAVRRLEALLSAGPPPNRPEKILVACAPDEEHVFSPLLISLLLRRRGWDVIYLGARVPLERFQGTIQKINPRLVIMAAQRLPTAASLMEVGDLLQKSEVPFAFGGAIFNRLPTLQERIPGHWLGDNLADVPQQVEAWLSSPGRQSFLMRGQPPDNGYRGALDEYTRHQGMIESDIWQLREQLGMSARQLSDINRHFAENICATLQIGDIALLSSEIDWVYTMLTFHQIPAQLLYDYLSAYHQSAQKHLSNAGALIVNGLGELAQKTTEL